MKIVDAKEALSGLNDGATVMIGGFMTNGTPEILIDEIIRRQVKDLTVIANDCGVPGKGVGRLVEARLIKKMIASHIGLMPLAGELMYKGEMEVELIPQGTLVEQIRCGGAGIGGFLTQTGLGTQVAEGKDIIEVDGTAYLLEKPLKAEFALIRASIIDESGNVIYKGSTRNFNSVMATAAGTVIAAAEEVVKVGEIAAEDVITPGIFVDYIVGGEAHGQ